MKSERNDEEARRAYWSTQMDAAYAFTGKMLEYPVEECGESLVSLKEAVAAEGLAVEFSQSLIAGQDARLFYLRSGLIPDFLAVAREMNARGWTLKVEDGFRSRAMQRHIALHENVLDLILKKVIWENHGAIPDPVFLFQRLTCLIATYPKIGTHMSGSAIDISVSRSADHVEVGRGAPYLEMSELTPMASPFVSAEASRNREAISDVMRRHGFIAYPQEFWHYSKGDAYAESLTASGRPARYGAVDVDLSTGRTIPIANPGESLHSMDDIRSHIALALSRIRKDT
jgi:D-alanyl-D-alanine dipeptidase